MSNDTIDVNENELAPGHDPITGQRADLKYEDENVVPVRDRSAAKKFTLKERYKNGINWGTTLWLTAMHIGAVAAFWFFTWQGLVALFALHFVTSPVWESPWVITAC